VAGQPERTGVLVLRVWVEGHTRSGVRARVTQTTDVTTSESAVVTVESVEQVCAMVRRWLESFLARAEGEDDGSPGAPVTPL
jgi:hypothetical protein